MKFRVVFGVDFSGAKEAGRNTWVARVEPIRELLRGRGVSLAEGPGPQFRLVSLASLETLSGTASRAPALAHLVDLILSSDRALWAMDFPFGLPIEVLGPRDRWPAQLALLRTWGEDAYGLGLECLRRAKQLGGPMHIRRLTDHEAKAPFDCYHYRIIYQTFYGMRDVLGPLWRAKGTAILPFQYRKLPDARRALVETCPSSTLKRLNLPHQNYKQPAGGPLTFKRRRTRHAILAGLRRYVEIDASQQRTLMRNGGGDALDAVIAAVGGHHAWRAADHDTFARHARYPREGKLFV